MLELRPFNTLGGANHGWLDAHHHFSFAEYYDPTRMNWGNLRVWNDDVIAPGTGFPKHPHRDMEILTYILSGALEHKDSMGNGRIIRAGELQYMSAGSGVLHSEFNPSASESVHLYQIWLLPEKPGLSPSYEQKRFEPAEQDGQWRVVAAHDGREGSLVIHQDAILYLARLQTGETLVRQFDPQRHGWLQVLRGNVSIGETKLAAGDALAMSHETELSVTANEAAELLLFDLA